jgi:hypothetical protein
MEEQEGKIPYTKPEALDLGSVAPVVGATCYPAGNGVLGGHCDTGFTAQKQCRMGESASHRCRIGDSTF